jgi:putative transposase
MRTYKYRIYPTKAQETLLNQQLELCRWVYNKTLGTRKEAWEQRQETMSLYDTINLLPEWKKAEPKFKLVYSQVLQNVQMRVDLAFKAFFRRVKAKEKDVGYPRFKGKGRYDSMCYPQYGNGVHLDGNLLSLSKIGQVKVELHRELCGTPKTVCIRRTSTGKWFATFSCACEAKPLSYEPKRVGVDVGLTAFATLSTGEKIDNPRFFRQDEQELAKAQRKLAKEEKGTPARAKRRKVVGRIHERITNQRADFAHQLSRRLVDTYGVIVFEDLSITNMLKNGNLSKSIADAAWHQLAQFTAYKAEDAGRLFWQVDPRNTSKKCSRCGSLVDKDLSVRVHDCPHCGLVLDRDHNAAINILALGLQCLDTSRILEAQALADACVGRLGSSHGFVSFFE